MRSLTEPRDLNSLSLDSIVQLAIDLREQRAAGIKASAKRARKIRESKGKKRDVISLEGGVISITKRKPASKKPKQDIIQEMQALGIEMTPDMIAQLQTVMAPKVRKPRKKNVKG